jgi:hypothetical protein
MGYPIATDQGLSTGAYTKSANLVVNRNQFLPKGRMILVARGSAIGMRATVNVGGVALCDDLVIPYIGTTGALSTKDHVILDQVVAGGVCEFFLRNTTVGALTTDFILLFEPMK